MNRRPQGLIAAAAALLALPVHAQQYLGLDTFYSTDADDTDIARVAVDFDFDHVDADHYTGLSLEQARYRPFGLAAVDEQRIYLRFAGGDQWLWKGRAGTDGHTVLGSASIHNDAARRQEYFIERDILETPQGLDERLYTTFVGAAFDTPLGARTTLTTVAGLQHFDGDNLRTHLRANLIHVLSEEHGVSAQLRTRYFHDSEANEADYYAPGWHAQAIPTLQLRRFVDGWRYQVAAGIGAQRSADTSWEAAHLFEASVTSPATDSDWTFRAGFLYTDTPGVTGGAGYDYRAFSLTVGRTF